MAVRKGEGGIGLKKAGISPIGPSIFSAAFKYCLSIRYKILPGRLRKKVPEIGCETRAIT